MPRGLLQPQDAGPGAPRRRHRGALVARQVRAGPASAVRTVGKTVERAAVEQFAAVLAGARADVHQPVRPAHRLVVVLDHQDGIASIPECREHVEQPVLLDRVQADRRLVEDVQDAAQVGADLGGEPEALRLSARERR